MRFISHKFESIDEKYHILSELTKKETKAEKSAQKSADREAQLKGELKDLTKERKADMKKIEGLEKRLQAMETAAIRPTNSPVALQTQVVDTSRKRRSSDRALVGPR